MHSVLKLEKFYLLIWNTRHNYMYGIVEKNVDYVFFLLKKNKSHLYIDQFYNKYRVLYGFLTQSNFSCLSTEYVLHKSFINTCHCPGVEICIKVYNAK